MNRGINYHKVQSTLAQLAYSFDDFSMDHFLQHIQQLRNRSIVCMPYPFSPGLSGAWVPGNRIDFIFYRSHTHRIHQNHIILHEIAHMLLDHPLRPIQAVLSPELLNELQASRGHLRTLEVNRSKDVIEEEAEYFVALIQKHVVRAQRMAQLTAGGSSITALQPYVRGLPYDSQWDLSE